MPPPSRALAQRPAVTVKALAPVPTVLPAKQKPASPLSPSNAVMLASLRAGDRKAVADPSAPKVLQDKVGNGAVAAGLKRGPGSDPKFAMLKKDVATKKRTVASSHPPPRTEATAAQAAALPPKDDAVAQGKTANAEKMNDAKPKDFDKDAFIKAVEKAIAEKAPKNLDEADKFADSNKPAEIRTDVQKRVGDGKQDSADQIATTTAASPDTSAAVSKDVVPMSPDRPPGTPAVPNPADATPDRLPPSATDMSAGPAEVDQQMADAQVTEPQLKKAGEPTFTKALTDKKAAEKHSDTTPDQLRKHETARLRDTTAHAKQRGTSAMTAIAATRVRTGQQLATGKTGTKGRDEDKRTQVTAVLQKVFDTMKADVEGILTGLDKLVDDQFTRGEKDARDKFTTEHKQKMDEYKDRRYSGWSGKARWLHDLFAGLPDEANQIFVVARDHYVQRMREVISNVADTIGRELNSAKKRIADGRTELQNEVRKLPKGLQAIGQQAAGEFSAKFDELTQSVDDKAGELVDTLATKYTDAVKSVDAEIAEEKEKNKGLVDKAVNAVKGVIDAILELKNLLLGVLRKAAAAIGAILKDPIGFLGNLISAVGGGLKLFMRNAGKHLEQGVLSWLLGTAATAGIQLPTSFDILGILLMIASLLGLTWVNVRARLVRKVPEPVVAAAETAIPLVMETRKRGVAGMWSELKARVGDLKKNLISNLVSFLLPTIIIAGVTWIISLFNPASAFIRACKMIIDIIRFIVTQGRQIIEFVNTVLDAVIAIAKGGTGGVPALVERALARSIPVLIGALAAILGVGGIASKIKEIFHKIAQPVNKAIDWVVDKIIGLVKKLWAKLKGLFGGKKRGPSLLARAKAKVRGGDDSPEGQRNRLDSALAASVRAVNKYQGRPVAGKVLRPLLAAIRLRYGLSVLQPVAKGEVWAVYGRINPEGTRDSDANTEGAQTDTAAFTEAAKAFERELAKKASGHPDSNSAMATMAGKAKAYIVHKVGGWHRADLALAAILEVVGQGTDPKLNVAQKSGFVGTVVDDVMAVFDEGTLSERFVHIVRFFTEVLGKDLADEAKAAQIDEFIVQAQLNVTFLRRRRKVMRRSGKTPQTFTLRDLVPRPFGSDILHQRKSRLPVPGGTNEEIGVPAAETGLELSERQVAAQRQLDPDWDKEQSVLHWIAGSKHWMMDDRSKWVKVQQNLDLPLAAGPSGTTNTMMTASVALGGEKYGTRLACIAFLIGARHHSLIEILVAAAPFSTTYNSAEPKKIYRDIQPLSEAELRACGKDGKFPDEVSDQQPGTITP